MTDHQAPKSGHRERTDSATEGAFETEIDVRTSDVGGSGHVNNSKFVDYMDLARDRFFESVSGYEPGDLEHVIASLELEFERELRSLDPVTVAVDVADVGRTSVTLDYEIRTDDAVVVTASTVAVVIDGVGSPTPIPEDLRASLTDRLDQ